MCNHTGISFVKKEISTLDLVNTSVLEVGSYNVNGSLRKFITDTGVAEYIGVDIQSGPGVDLVLDANNLVKYFKEKKFDLVISTETIEHVQDWATVISNLKRITAPDGHILITTRSKGFHYHGYPFDFWRFEIDDFENILSDFTIKNIERDSREPGVFLIAQKPKKFCENNYTSFPRESYALYSILTDSQVVEINQNHIYLFKKSLRGKLLMTMDFIIPILAKIVPYSVRTWLKKLN